MFNVRTLPLRRTSLRVFCWNINYLLFAPKTKKKKLHFYEKQKHNIIILMLTKWKIYIQTLVIVVVQMQSTV